MRTHFKDKFTFKNNFKMKRELNLWGQILEINFSSINFDNC